MKEIQLKRVAGPFKDIPFQDFMQSPIGLVPKAGGTQTRLIFHLSYDFKSDGLRSLNYHTPKELCTVHYKDLDYAVRTYLLLCEQEDNDGAEENDRNKLKKSWKRKFDKHKKSNKPVIVAGKSDIKSAFRLLGLA